MSRSRALLRRTKEDDDESAQRGKGTGSPGDRRRVPAPLLGGPRSGARRARCHRLRAQRLRAPRAPWHLGSVRGAVRGRHRSPHPETRRRGRKALKNETKRRAAAAFAEDRPLSLADAVKMALENAEGVVIQRESLAAAEAGVSGAEGVYDPRLGAEAFWNEGRLPVNSAFSGAPEGRLAPNAE